MHNAGGYPYTADLRDLERCRSNAVTLERIAGVQLDTMASPLVLQEWDKALEKHPDQVYAKFLGRGLHQGFRVGFNRSQSLRSAKNNMKSAVDHPEVVSKYLAEEVAAGRVIGPIPEEATKGAHLHISRFGVIPKPNKPGHWRLIVDLSFPPGASVNDGINPELCSLKYTKVDEVAKVVQELGRGSELAKADIKAAYRIVPVHPQDRQLLAMKWQGDVYIDTALPFGLRSAPKLFNAVADALEWCVKEAGTKFLWHYLDDFITVGKAGSGECEWNVAILNHVCNRLGVPLAAEKCEGPATCLTFLGIDIDSRTMEIRLPQVKLARLKEEVRAWGEKKSCTKRELQSLTGHLQHAATVVQPGRTFIRRLYDLLAVGKVPHHHLRLNAEARSDLAWWATFLETWNGVSLMANHLLPPRHVVVSDASGTWGCGAYHGHEWFQLPWAGTPLSGACIAVKELVPLILSVALWGGHWTGATVLCKCDNEAVVAVITTRSARDKQIVQLLRCLFFFEAHYDCHLVASHITGAANELADHLSRNRATSFLQGAHPATSPTPRVVPRELQELAFSQHDWTSASWRALFKSTLQRV